MYGGEQTILSIDVSDPSLPRSIGLATHKFEDSLSLLDAAFPGDLAFLATDAGSFVFDFKDKTQLKEISKLSHGEAHKILIHQNHAYIREYSDSHSPSTLKIVNISDPSQPLNVPFDSPSDVRDFEITGTLIHVLTRDTLRVYDISNPEMITESGTYPINKSFVTVQIRESSVYLSNSTEMNVYDLSDPSQLNLVTGLSNLVSQNVFKIGNQKAFFAGRKGMQIFDISVPENFPSTLFFETPDAIAEIDVSNNYIYAVDGVVKMEGPGPKGFHIIDITDKEQPEEQSFYRYESAYSKNSEIIKTGNDLAFGFPDNDLTIMDISDPLKPVEIDHDFDLQQDFCWSLRGIETYKDEIFISCGSSEINVINVSDLSKPVLTTPIEGHHMVVSDACGYVINGSVLNILDLGHPQKQALGSVDLKNKILQLHVNPPYACVVSKVEDSTGNNGYQPVMPLDLKILDISDPSRPFVAGSCVIPDMVNYYDQPTYMKNVKIQVGENHVYLSNRRGTEGIRIIDIKDPQTPHEVSRLKTLGQAYDIIFSEGYLYVADGTGGLSIFKNMDTAPATDDTPAKDDSGSGGGCFINSLIHQYPN